MDVERGHRDKIPRLTKGVLVCFSPPTISQWVVIVKRVVFFCMKDLGAKGRTAHFPSSELLLCLF